MPERNEPVTTRPFMPGYGIATDPDGLLPWSWAIQRLQASHGFWVATSSARYGPHLAAVWAVWFNEALHLSTGGHSRKARNLADDPRCVISTTSAAESVVVEGLARRLTDAAAIDAVRTAYIAKYGSGFPDPDESPLFAVTPVTAFGLAAEEAFTTSATRWQFGFR